MRRVRQLVGGARGDGTRDTLLFDIHAPRQQQRRARAPSARLRDEGLQRIIRATDHRRGECAAGPSVGIGRPVQCLVGLDDDVLAQRTKVDAGMTDARRARGERESQHALDIVLAETRRGECDRMDIRGVEHARLQEGLRVLQKRGGRAGAHATPPPDAAPSASSTASMVSRRQRCANTPRQRPVSGHRGVSAPAKPRMKR